MKGEITPCKGCGKPIIGKLCVGCLYGMAEHEIPPPDHTLVWRLATQVGYRIEEGFRMIGDY